MGRFKICLAIDKENRVRTARSAHGFSFGFLQPDLQFLLRDQALLTFRVGRFNKQDIRELCPTLSDSSIEGALRKLVVAGELKKEGRGKNTCYFRLN